SAGRERALRLAAVRRRGCRGRPAARQAGSVPRCTAAGAGRARQRDCRAHTPAFGLEGGIMSIVVATRDGATTTLSSATVDAFGRTLRAPLLAPQDAGFAEAARLWNGMVQRTPALVAQPESASDVATAVAFARDHGVLLGVRGGGHNIAGSAVPERGLVLDMSRMRSAVVEP